MSRIGKQPITVPDAYDDELDDDAPIQAALDRLPAPRSPDILMEKLVLKGGNALDLVHRIGGRASMDIDLSIDGEDLTTINVPTGSDAARLAGARRSSC